MYKVLSIKNHDGTNRLDGRYPLRVGRLCNFCGDLETGKCLYIEWLQNADGSPYGGWFRTSLVKQIEYLVDGTIIVTTNNSIYTFQKTEGTEGGIRS